MSDHSTYDALRHLADSWGLVAMAAVFLLNIPMRYGEWKFQGYLMYTDGIRDQLHTDTQLYGGAGISFHY